MAFETSIDHSPKYVFFSLLSYLSILIIFVFMLLFRYKPPAEVFVVAVAHRPGVFDKIFLVTTKNETSGELLLYSKRYRSHI